MTTGHGLGRTGWIVIGAAAVGITTAVVIATNEDQGVVFSLNPDGSGYRVLKSFGGGASDGAQPRAPLVQAADGMLFGTTYAGGASSLADLETVTRLGEGRIDLTIGSALDIFGGSGVGKSTLLGAMSRHNFADVSVIALIGERNREVRAFLEHELGPEGMKRSVVICATSDRPAPLRVRACFVALAVAEYFRDRGADVLLVMDSVTRLAMAQREIGLNAGEPPSQKGYTPSVFGLLPKVFERAGRFRRGSITGFFTVLVEGDDFNEPICDAVRAILDGHIEWRGDGFCVQYLEQQFKPMQYPEPGPNGAEIRMIHRHGGSFISTMTDTSKWVRMYQSPKLEFVVMQDCHWQSETTFGDVILRLSGGALGELQETNARVAATGQTIC